MVDFQYILASPVIVLAAYGLLALVLAPGLRDSSRFLGIVALIGFGVTGWSLWDLWRRVAVAGPLETASGLIRIDEFGLFFSAILLVVAALSVLVSISFLEREEADRAEFYPLMLLCLAGMFLMLQTTNLIMVLVGLEVFSLALYVVCGITRDRPRSIEAALKYFLLGAFSSGFIVYGMALLYGAAGSLDMLRIGSIGASEATPLLWIGMGLVLVGLAFKIAIVPFHHWVPDVYQGAPTNVTGFMAAATKTAAFAVLLRFLLVAFGDKADVWGPLIAVLAVLTMTVANLVALAQTDLKRLLAFSSIAHAGYLLVAVVSQPDDAVTAVLFYLTSYAFMTVGAFAVLAAVGRGDAEGERGYSLAEWSGLGWRRPVLGAAMTLFLLSLAGIPPTGGFLGKYMIFMAAVNGGQQLLAVIMALNAAIATYYYLRIIVHMYMREADLGEDVLPVSPAMAAVMITAVAATLYLGLAPGSLLATLTGLAGSLI
jgi:NADH-quinone oxidoreductase subunit N